MIGRGVHLYDFTFLEEFTDLFINRLLSFGSKTPSLLLDRFKGWADVQSMSDHGRVNSANIFLLLGEYLHVLL